MFERLRGGRQTDTPTRSKTATELVGLALTVALLVGATGVTGAVMSAVLVLVWLRLPVEYTFALGQVALVVFATGRFTLALLIAVEASLGLLLVGSLSRATRSPLPGAVWLLALPAFGGGAWFVVQSGVALWQVAVVLWPVGTAAAYGLYRHQLVTLGLADTDGGHYS